MWLLCLHWLRYIVSNFAGDKFFSVYNSAVNQTSPAGRLTCESFINRFPKFSRPSRRKSESIRAVHLQQVLEYAICTKLVWRLTRHTCYQYFLHRALLVCCQWEWILRQNLYSKSPRYSMNFPAQIFLMRHPGIKLSTMTSCWNKCYIIFFPSPSKLKICLLNDKLICHSIIININILIEMKLGQRI